MVESTAAQHAEFDFNIPNSLEDAHMFHLEYTLCHAMPRSDLFIYSNLRLHNALKPSYLLFNIFWYD